MFTAVVLTVKVAVVTKVCSCGSGCDLRRLMISGPTTTTSFDTMAYLSQARHVLGGDPVGADVVHGGKCQENASCISRRELYDVIELGVQLF